MIERDIVGGAAHLWDCIPSKAMVATGNELTELALAKTMGLEASGRLDVDALRDAHRGHGGEAARAASPACSSRRACASSAAPAGSPARTPSRPTPTTAPRSSKPTRSCSSTGSRPRVPDWATIDGERILTTRQAYPPPEIPEHLVVIGSGVTGVEFTHMFSALGVAGDADRVAPAGAAVQGPRGRGGARGRVPPARREAAEGRARDLDRAARTTRCSSRATTAARSTVRTRCSCIGSIPNSEGLGCEAAGRRGRRQRLHPRQPPLPDERAAHLLGGRRLGPAAAVVGRGDAGPQDRRARDGPHRPCAPPPRLRQGRAGDLHRSRDRRGRRRRGRGVRGRAASCGSRRCRSRRTRRRSSTATRAAS